MISNTGCPEPPLAELQKEQTDVEYILRERNYGTRAKKLPTQSQVNFEEKIANKLIIIRNIKKRKINCNR